MIGLWNRNIRLELPELCYLTGWQLMRAWYRTCFHTLYDEKKTYIYIYIYMVRCVNCHLNFAKMKITIYYINQNYMKISWNTINKIYSKKSQLASIIESKLQNLLRDFQTFSLIKLQNVGFIIAFSSFLVMHEVLLVSRTTITYTQ